MSSRQWPRLGGKRALCSAEVPLSLREGFGKASSRPSAQTLQHPELKTRPSDCQNTPVLPNRPREGSVPRLWIHPCALLDFAEENG